ncbi:MAG TPA: polysaccharide biosynthesis protein, partial [Nitrospirae bacterium]|nr:polysaccharide biosynthesis protein [Nitrospirota bacterium]
MVIRHRRIIITLNHLLLAAISNYCAFLIRFEGVIPLYEVERMLAYMPVLLLVRLVVYLWGGMHKGLWRYASIRDLIEIFKTVSVGTLVLVLVVRIFLQDISYPRSIYILDWMLLIFLSGGVRFLMRVYREYLQNVREGIRLIIIGAGDAGEMIVRDMNNNPNYNYRPVGFIDDNVYKRGQEIHGVPILGSMDKIEELVEVYKPDEFLICIPSASDKAVRRIYDKLRGFNLPVKTLPRIADIVKGDVNVSHIKPLTMEDLLLREPVLGDIDIVRELVEGKVVLVTGAGGSIGSELCRQIFQYRPSKLIMLDRYENGLYDVDLEIRGMKNDTTIPHTVIADVLDARRVDGIFKRFLPNIVFHAAAHKHVPLMETNPLEAVKNNVFGTHTVINCAIHNKAERFVLISTDKAVNPTNVMGATKRIAEYLALTANDEGDTRFTVVRFGNVLGSNGSVFHVFKSQIEKGGPVTVTHPDITRFFMLIPEAVQLALQATSYGSGGEIFVLDMGDPIRIADFAENIIRLSGFI